MTRDAHKPINVERANGIAQARSGGEMSIVREDDRIQLCRKGYIAIRELNPERDMTEAGIVKALAGWENWPANPSQGFGADSTSRLKKSVAGRG